MYIFMVLYFYLIYSTSIFITNNTEEKLTVKLLEFSYICFLNSGIIFNIEN
jgi:hypothetical protein